MLLQNFSHASAIVAALFIPRIRPWLMELAKIDAALNSQASEQNLRQAVEIMMKAGNDDVPPRGGTLPLGSTLGQKCRMTCDCICVLECRLCG